MSKATRATPRTRLPPRQRQSDIIKAAQRVFETRGYESWTVADVAKEAGVVEGTVLHYFGSKNNLIASVIAAFYADITEAMEKGVRSVTGVRNQMRFVVYTHTRTLVDNTDLCSLMLKVARESDRALGTQVHELNRRYTRVVFDIVESGKSSGEISESVSPHLVRHVLFGAMEHYLWDIIYSRKDVDPSAVADELTDLVYCGIAAQPSNLGPEIAQLVMKLNNLMK